MAHHPVGRFHSLQASRPFIHVMSRDRIGRSLPQLKRQQRRRALGFRSNARTRSLLLAILVQVSAAGSESQARARLVESADHYKYNGVAAVYAIAASSQPRRSTGTAANEATLIRTVADWQMAPPGLGAASIPLPASRLVSPAVPELVGDRDVAHAAPVARFHQAQRFTTMVPSSATLGQEIRLRLLNPYDKSVKLYALEVGDAGEVRGHVVPVRLEPTADGESAAVIPVLIPGDVRVTVFASFHDGVISQRYFRVKVSPPVVAPAEFHVDYSSHPTWHESMHVVQGFKGILQPGATFGVAPTTHVELRGGVTFAVMNAGTDPAIAVDSQGILTARHAGHGVVLAWLGPFHAELDVEVRANDALVCERRILPQQPDGTGRLILIPMVCQP